jgi:ADP-dependent phosphofructokinase/glucokinase
MSRSIPARASGVDWTALYSDVMRTIPSLAKTAPMTFAGMGSCVDAVVPLSDLVAIKVPNAPEQLAGLTMELLARAASGIGGEIRVDWPNGPAWLRQHLTPTLALGGTAPQAAMVLARLGAPVLLALEDRSAYLLEQIPEGVGIAENGRLISAEQTMPHGEPRPEVFIFEFTAEASVGSIVPPRSSRVIARFSDPDLDQDAEFVALSTSLAGNAGSALISGLSAVAKDRIDAQIEYVKEIVKNWRAAGLGFIHLELATFADLDCLALVLANVSDVFTSLGMSESEFQKQVAREEVTPESMIRLADSFGLQRLCIHSDLWAATATLGEAKREQTALVCGSILASTRAATGRIMMPHVIPHNATFAATPWLEMQELERWKVVTVASPYVQAPATTLGLGDTFTAGCLLALGRRRPS